MKFKIPKNRIIPLIILTIISMIMSMILGLYRVDKMTQYSNESMNENYDSIAEKTAALIKQGIENKFQSITVDANLIGQAGELNKERILSLLPLLEKKESYIDLAIVDLEGKGYDITGEELDVSNKMYFIKAKYGEVNVSNSLSYKNTSEPIMVYAAPIMENKECKGVLLTIVSAQIDMTTFKDEGELEEGLIYLLNQTNELIAFSKGSDIKNFYYDRVIAKGYLYSDYQHKNSDSNPFRLHHMLMEKEEKLSYVWFQKPLGINKWTILVGRSDKISPITENILMLTITTWIITMAGMFLLFMMMIYFQSRSNRKLIRMLYYDPITGGNNWYKFRRDMNKILNSRLFRKKRFALINFDIDRFKIINDTFGHQKGDEILKEIYYVLSKWVKRGEPFTRYAADQFYVLMTYQEEEEITARINELDERMHCLRDTKTAKFYYGVYLVTERKDSVDRMGDFAGIAKHTIKGSNEVCISYFDDVARVQILKEEEIEKTMHEALKNNDFVVYLQPKFSLKGENISGAEALVRWKDKEGNLVAPSSFIPVFEKNGFITKLDNYMVRKVCEIIRVWIDKGYRVLPVSINLSRVHFTDTNLAYSIKQIVDECNVPHELIELELTESAFMQNKEVLIRTVVLLRQFGFLVSMDDFGSGYSSLNSLKDLPLDVVKLDGELFNESEDIERGHTVIRNTVSMAKDLHMEVVAEGIETKEQIDFLSGIGCDTVQGYYYAKPMPVNQFELQYYESK